MPADQLIAGPASEPVTLQEAKDHLRLETALDDSQVSRLISMARAYIEQVCWRQLVTQTWERVLESFAGDDTLELGTRGRRLGNGSSFNELPRGNLSTSGFLPWISLPKGSLWANDNPATPPSSQVLSVKYTDENGALQTLDPAQYTVDASNEPGRVRLAYGAYWPSTRWPQFDAVRIRYVVGWDVTAGVWAGPAPLKQAMLLLVSQLYEHRSPEVVARGIQQIQFSANALIRPYRLNRGF